MLRQSYTNFEYILVDNCSTDGSAEIAEAFARRDARIRFIRRIQLLPQVQNYNEALAAIANESSYCKIAQADDYLFPDCLKLMVRAFQQSESIGLVSAYDLKANMVRGSGFPYEMSPLSGRETARLYLQDGIFAFGSPTTVMYRSSLVREKKPFYNDTRLHEDTEKCMEILESWDFAFVPQVLSFLRADNESISSAVRSLQPSSVDRYIIVQRYASVFLPVEEAALLKKQARRDYYEVLAQAAIRFRERAFWDYHQKGLKTLGESMDSVYLGRMILGQLLWMLGNPGETLSRILRFRSRKRTGATAKGAM